MVNVAVSLGASQVPIQAGLFGSCAVRNGTPEPMLPVLSPSGKVCGLMDTLPLT